MWKAPATFAVTRRARSDQCDNCGNVLEPEKLLNPRSKVDGSTPELRETEHFYLDLSKLEPEVANFLRERSELHARDRAGRIACGRSKPRVSNRARSRVTWIGASRSRWMVGMINGCTSGSKRSSVTSRRRSSGRRISGDPDAWKELVGEPVRAGLLFYRQGQHLFPYRHVAC